MTDPLTPSQQLDNLIRWRDELASGRWNKCESRLSDDVGRYCAVGVLFDGGVLGLNRAAGLNYLNTFGISWEFHENVVDRNNDNPGDRFAAVIEYLNEEV